MAGIVWCEKSSLKYFVHLHSFYFTSFPCIEDVSISPDQRKVSDVSMNHYEFGPLNHRNIRAYVKTLLGLTLCPWQIYFYPLYEEGLSPYRSMKQRSRNQIARLRDA